MHVRNDLEQQTNMNMFITLINNGATEIDDEIHPLGPWGPKLGHINGPWPAQAAINTRDLSASLPRVAVPAKEDNVVSA
jgi:hypothetical protein